MTYIEFCILLASYLALVVASLAFPGVDAQNKQLHWLINLKNPYRIVAVALGISILVVHLIGFIGLFLLWPIAPYLFFWYCNYSRNLRLFAF